MAVRLAILILIQILQYRYRKFIYVVVQLTLSDVTLWPAVHEAVGDSDSDLVSNFRVCQTGFVSATSLLGTCLFVHVRVSETVESCVTIK